MAGRAVVRRMVEEISADPRYLEGVVDAARASSPPVAALPVADVRRHIAALLTAVGAALRAGPAAGFPAADRLAADRALQGIPLDALLDGFQAGRRHVMLELFARATEGELSLAELAEVLADLDAYSNELQNRLIHAYRETELAAARTAHAARLSLLREILHGGPVGRAAEIGLDPARRHHLAVADVSDPHLARPVEAAISDGVCGLVDGYLCWVSPRPPAPVVPGLLMVTSPAVPVGGLAAAFELCLAAVFAARRRGLCGLRRLVDLAPALAADAYPRLGDLLADDLLAGLNPRDEFHRLLAETAAAYLTHGGRADRTAAALHVHPNTVKHRLRRLGELTGFDPVPDQDDALGTAIRWSWALQTWLRR